ncbi:uncharacterized protein LOC102801004 [Saccoglossus kowalevskii]|uniref:Uncharacterized protein LOC102801004 n=1 Tax=Saccoglossus kowalevskii TaxID=10224 RepID=A0ABM0M888_SACKO|nr:PREDICTED: uncharacterized protein LOC102801004 [Saccoglossus kowalevskii]
MAYAIGNFITQAKSWRWAFFIAGIPGFVLGVLIILTMMEPERKKIPKENNQEMKVSEYNSLSFCSKVGRVAKPFCNPSLLFICFAGAVRNGAGYVWAYNTQPFFDQYYPEVNTGMWLSWIPLVSGSISVVLGGFIADRVVKKSGPVGRIWVIVVSLLLASPFAALTLWLAPPWAFIMQIPTYIFGEMWVGVTLTVIVELVPSTIRTAAIAVYFFIISNIGGTMPLLVTPLADLTNLKIALLILYPGMYVTGALLYVTTLFVLKRDIDKAHNMDALTYSLLKDSEKSDGTSDVEDDTKKPSYGTVEN